MLFNSYDYFFFLTFVYLLYRFRVGVRESRHLFLLAASFVFYGWWSPAHILLLVYSGLSDFSIARWMNTKEAPTHRRKALSLSILNNLGLLCCFKYLSPAVDQINEWLAYTPVAYKLFNPELVLPVGISFYTFQTMSYAFDVYRKNIKPMNSLVAFMTYVAFFPQLVAGPILRAKEFIPQMAKPFAFNQQRFFVGIFFILFGLAKKLIIADPIGVYIVDPVFNNPHTSGGLEVIWASYAYGLQLYNDFSGYSDIAIGSAMLLGYHIPINFDAPLICTNPVDFWNRWHISLSHWVRDYVFMPLNFSQRLKGKFRINMFITLTLIGVWHGARWTYLFFGLWHSLLSIAHRYYNDRFSNSLGTQTSQTKLFFHWVVYWQLLSISFLLFRANSMSDAWQLFSSLSNVTHHISFDLPPAIWFSLLIGIGSAGIRAKGIDQLANTFAKIPLLAKVAVVFILLSLLTHYDFLMGGRQAFIYFQF